MTGPDISPIPREARAYQGVRAGLATRGIACLIDGAVVGVILLFSYLGLVGILFLVDPRSFSFPDPSPLMSLTAAFIVSVLYLTASWWLVGRSYGAHVMGIRVVGGKQQRLGPLRALLRAGFCVAFPIGLLWCAVSPYRRSVQDAVLWTSVIYDWVPRSTHEAPHGPVLPEEPPVER